MVHLVELLSSKKLNLAKRETLMLDRVNTKLWSYFIILKNTIYERESLWGSDKRAGLRYRSERVCTILELLRSLSNRETCQTQ